MKKARKPLKNKAQKRVAVEDPNITRLKFVISLTERAMAVYPSAFTGQLERLREQLQELTK